MDTERWLVVRDVLIGLGPVCMPGWFLADRIGPWAIVPIVVAGLVAGWPQYRSERDAHPEWLTDLSNRPLALVGIGVVALVVGLAPLALVPSIVPWYLAAFVGFGLGFVGHRILFGVVYPIPEQFVRRVREQGG